MRVVVVGATGNVGTSVVERLVTDPRVDTIVGVARRVPSFRLPKVEWQRADIGVDPLDALVAGADVVVHLAWLIQPQRDAALLGRTNIVGTMRLLNAALRTRVPAFVYASSVGTYAPGAKEPSVDETWPATGVASSIYSRHKATVESLLDDVERDHPLTRIVRMRTSLVFQRQAASEIGRLFLGPFVPRALLRPARIPLVPATPDLVVQATHASDIGAAYHEAIHREVRGAFNIAAEPVLAPPVLASALDAHAVPLPAAVLRAGLATAYRLRLAPIEKGWIDMALRTPIMDTTRARDELGWRPQHTATDAVVELLDGLADKAGGPTPPLER